jgi:predicted ABC-type transport system involved in lysophospholipase L1 biosynthesis ATPase subunit
MRPIAELVNVSREFDGGRIVALRSVSLEIDEGESVAVTGRSGSGKSTLLNLICGLDHPSSGEVRFGGHRVSTKAAWARIRANDVGIVFQSFCLIPTLSARQNVEVAMTAGRDAARRARALELLDMVGMADRADHIPAELSGGERQRIGIVRALVNRPRLVLADEPTGSLDRATGESVLALLSEMRTRFATALVLITHDPDVESRCERRIALEDGRVVSQPIRTETT